MNVGDLVIWRGRVYRLLGFDPMSMVEPRAYLEDPETDERVAVPAAEVAPGPPEPAPG